MPRFFHTQCIYSTHSALQAHERLCSVLYLQHGGGNYFCQNDITVTRCYANSSNFAGCAALKQTARHTGADELT